MNESVVTSRPIPAPPAPWVRTADFDYDGPTEWLFVAPYRGLRIACGYNDAGPCAWVGHPTRELWIDSTACDSSFESASNRARELADETLRRPDMQAMLELPSEVVAAAGCI